MTAYEPYKIEDVILASQKKLFNVISTFAGGGGSSTGYKLAGGKVLCANEFVEEAVATYRANYPDTLVICDDIKSLPWNFYKLEPGTLDILDGSPPCSAFSISDPKGMNNKWKGAISDTTHTYFNDEGDAVSAGDVKVATGIKKYSDGKTVEAIEDLFLEFIRIASGLRPKIIVAENVKGITLEANREKLIEFVNKFERISPGYLVTYRVLNAAEYGVPQSRRRCFFIAIREDIAAKVGINFMNMDDIVFPKKTTPMYRDRDVWCGGVSIASAIEGIENDPDEVQMLRDYCAKSFQFKYISIIPFNPEKVIKPSGSCFNIKRPSPQLPCPTLTQTGQKLAPSGVMHYAENRKLTIVEMKRIMSLPDDFKLTGTFDQQAERIGRMVAPKMMAAIASNLYEKVLSKL